MQLSEGETVTFNDLIQRYGDHDQAIADKLGVSRQLVAHWRKAGISEARQAWIQQVTRGRIKAVLRQVAPLKR